MTASLRALILAAALVGAESSHAAAPPAPTAPARPAPGDLPQRLAAVEKQLAGADDNLTYVESQYTKRPEPSDAEERNQRFSAGELQYLLRDWVPASVLFYDLVSDPKFKDDPRYKEALFYLADSLYEQKNDISARMYLRELLSMPSSDLRFRQALSRYIAVAGRLNQFDDVDGYIEQARRMSNGVLPPDLAYVHAKWVFRRKDLPDAERIARARAAFAPLADSPSGAYRLQAAYHLGVLSVQSGELSDAITRFQQLIATPAAEGEAGRIRELALMSLGRLLYEVGRYDEALNCYRQIPQESESFPEARYEVAWVHVKRGDYPQAMHAIDILLIVAPESPLEPEARLLQGTLLQKMQRYDDATLAYGYVIETYGPVRDRVDALLRVNHDPVTYFDKLLARADGTTDVRSLLPPLALKFASTQKDVARGVAMVGDLDRGHEGATQAKAIADRILQALDERGLETFPELQDGYTRADAVATALTHAEDALLEVESAAVEARLSPAERERLLAARREREALRVRFAALPTTQADLEARRKRMRARVDDVDHEAFGLGYELQGLDAIATAIREWVDSSRPTRHSDPDEEREFLGQLQAETLQLKQLRAELDQARARLADARHAVGTSLSGEQTIRELYADALRREHDVMRGLEGRLPEETGSLLQRAHAMRDHVEALRARVKTAKGVLQAQVERRGRVIRDKVRSEQQLLQRYESEVAAVSGNARNLVGQIAYASFQRVRQQFYDLVLKADVGVVDVAFTQKQDKTTEVQKYSAQKAQALRELDAEFKAVLAEERE